VRAVSVGQAWRLRLGLLLVLVQSMPALTLPVESSYRQVMADLAASRPHWKASPGEESRALVQGGLLGLEPAPAAPQVQAADSQVLVQG
jgi:hypothetical protein